MHHSAVKLYQHVISVDNLEIGKRYRVVNGTYLTLVKREGNNHLFAISVSGKQLNTMIEDINNFGRVKINILEKNNKMILFNTLPQEFTPTKEWVHHPV